MSPSSSATAPPLSAFSAAHHHTHFLQNQIFPSSAHTSFRLFYKAKRSLSHTNSSSRLLLTSPSASISRYESSDTSSVHDPELRSVLVLATDSELYEVEKIMFGPSYFSPLLKSVTKGADVDHFMIGEDPGERDNFISMLESRFLFLAADARSTLRGWRPSYRNVLLGVRKKLNIPCSSKLSTEDLEAEIFLHLWQEYSSEEAGTSSSSSDGSSILEYGISQWKVQKFAGLKIGATQLSPMILKGGGMLTLEKLFEALGGRLSGKLISEAAKYQMKKEVLKKGGQLAAINLEAGSSLLAARQGLKVAATRYLGLRGFAQLLGPMMWGTLLADAVIQMLGTDYARILRAIYAFAQIRMYRGHKTESER